MLAHWKITAIKTGRLYLNSISYFLPWDQLQVGKPMFFTVHNAAFIWVGFFGGDLETGSHEPSCRVSVDFKRWRGRTKTKGNSLSRKSLL